DVGPTQLEVIPTQVEHVYLMKAFLKNKQMNKDTFAACMAALPKNVIWLTITHSRFLSYLDVIPKHISVCSEIKSKLKCLRLVDPTKAPTEFQT
ncbi:hypothetical protein ACKI1O_48770, partial [Streptomyces scabiei]